MGTGALVFEGRGRTDDFASGAAFGSGTNNTVVNNTVGSLPRGGAPRLYNGQYDNMV